MGIGRAFSIAGCLLLAPAVAQAQVQARSFSIPAQPVEKALLQLAREADRNVVYEPRIVVGRRSSPVRAAASFEAALDQLLAGTGLTWRRGAAGMVMIQLAPTRPAPARPGARSAPSVSAPTGEPADGAATPAGQVAEVIVSVQKRAERAQDVPISMTVLEGRQIAELRLEQLRDVARLTPGLLVSTFSANSPVIAIRGASNTFQQIGVNKPVSIVVDDVFLPRNTVADVELFDVASVQVLKGPQGTLFGRNVTGGVVVIDTGKPSLADASSMAQISLGNYRAVELRGFASMPLGDNAAIKLAVSARDREGYGRDRLTGQELDDLKTRQVRLQGRFAPREDLDLLATVDYTDDHSAGRTLSSKTLGADGDRRTAELGVVQRFDRTQGGASFRAAWSAPFGSISSISAYRTSQSGEFYSGVGANFRFLISSSQALNDDADHIETATQELRYASPRFAWGDFVAGTFYLKENAERTLKQTALAARSGALVTNLQVDQDVEATSIGVFVDGGFNLPADLRLTLGGRYTRDEKTVAVRRTDRFNPAGSYALSGLSRAWSEFTPRAVLSWTPRDGLLGYASVAKGFTSGGFNTEAATSAALSTAFSPETVINYEMGVKSDWWDRRLRLNASAFHMKYRDKQELYFDGVTRILNIVNAAEATSKGFELEASVVPVSGVTLALNYGHLETRYQNFVIPGGANNTGNRLGSSPKDKYSFLADFRHPIGDWGYVVANASYTRTGGYFTGAAKDVNLFVPAYDLLNASTGLETRDGRLRMTVWGKNLEDTNYVLIPSTQVVLGEYLGEPRTYGLTLTARF